MTISKPDFYPDGSAIGDGTDITVVKANIADALRTTGYAADAILASAEYNEMFKEFGQWTKWIEQQITILSPLVSTLEGFGVYTDLGLTGGDGLTTGSVIITGGVTAATVIIKSGFYFINQYNIHLDIVIDVSAITGTMTSLAITLPDVAKCLARYVGFDGAQFLINNTDGSGPQSIPCTAGFWYANNILNIGRSVTAEDTYVPFLIDTSSGKATFSVAIDYEMNH